MGRRPPLLFIDEEARCHTRSYVDDVMDRFQRLKVC